MSVPAGTAPEPWVMPEWMEPYRNLIQNTGGNEIEWLMNQPDGIGRSNLVLSALVISVDSQVTLLHRMRHKGLIP